MIPIRDGIPTRRFPVVTVLFILINIGVFGVQMFVLGSRGEGALQQALFTYGLVPARVAEDLGRPPGSPSSPRCSCTAGSCTSPAICSICGSSATTSRM